VRKIKGTVFVLAILFLQVFLVSCSDDAVRDSVEEPSMQQEEVDELPADSNENVPDPNNEEPNMAAPEDIRDLVHAEFELEFITDSGEIVKSFILDDAESLLWIETNFGSAVERGSIHVSDNQPMCPFWAELHLRRSDGATGVIYPATDDCRMFIFGDNYYSWGSGTNSSFYELFGVSHVDALFVMD